MADSKYKYVWGNSQYLITVETNLNSFIRFPEIPWNNVKDAIEFVRKGKATCYHGAKDLERDVREGERYLDADFFERFISGIKNVCRKHDQVFHEVKRLNISAASNEELLATVMKLTDQWTHTVSYFRGNQDEGTMRLIEEIKKLCRPEDLSILLTPHELDIVNREQIDWNLIPTPSEDNIRAHLEKHPWLAGHHYSIDQIIKELQTKYKETQSETPRNIIEEKAQLKKKQEEIIGNDSVLEELIRRAHTLAITRFDLKARWVGTDYHLLPIIEEIAKRTGESSRDILDFYRIEDIKNLLEGVALEKREKENRDKCFVALLEKGHISYFSGEQGEKLIQEKLGITSGIAVKELKGAVAYKGKVSGVVRILGASNSERAAFLRKDFKHGEILVTEMTQPNIVDIARRAGAIITDEGGMLSHAAVIAREFKIPCIVGTHQATQVLKDGDRVEVDAEKGIVTIS